MSSAPENSDHIVRDIIIHAPRGRVWRALTLAEEFGAWFGVRLDGQTFAPGQRVRGPITACGHEHAWFDVVVERLEPQDHFAFRWHPFAVDPAIDVTREQPTLVTFTLQDAPGNGTLLTVVESGFDRLPPHRRLDAFRMNSRGWEGQMHNIAKHAST